MSSNVEIIYGVNFNVVDLFIDKGTVISDVDYSTLLDLETDSSPVFVHGSDNGVSIGLNLGGIDYGVNDFDPSVFNVSIDREKEYTRVVTELLNDDYVKENCSPELIEIIRNAKPQLFSVVSEY